MEKKIIADWFLIISFIEIKKIVESSKKTNIPVCLTYPEYIWQT
jgi:hypothetical protein